MAVAVKKNNCNDTLAAAPRTAHAVITAQVTLANAAVKARAAAVQLIVVAIAMIVLA